MGNEAFALFCAEAIFDFCLIRNNALLGIAF
jgi:hypothetical protein